MSDVKWYDIVPHEDWKEFLRQEASYCQDALGRFYRLPDGNKREEARQEVLSKRLKFLEIWCIMNNCRHSYDNMES